MSRYGFFACMDCHIMLWLGKAVFKDDEHINYFHIGQREDVRNAQNLQLDRVLWKMLADHARHPLRVVLDDDEEFDLLDDFVEIGGDEHKDISFEQYLKDWPG